MNILYLVSDGFSEFNSSNYRVCQIADALRQEHTVSIISIRQWLMQSEYCKRMLSDADIIHVQRVLLDETYQHLDYWRNKRGKAIVVDIDDHYELIHHDNASADFWKLGKVTANLETVSYERSLDVHPLQQFKQGLNYVTALISPSDVLGEWWRPYLPTYTVPNYVKFSRYDLPKIDGDRIILFWGGSLSHTQSWTDSGIQEALQRILVERENAYLLIMGDDRVLDSLPLRRDKVLFMPYVPFWEWPKMLQSATIGLAPLAGAYDDGRSALKVTEYIASKTPFVASNSIIYKGFKDATSGLFTLHDITDKASYEDRIASWYESTIAVIDNLEYYTEQGNLCRERYKPNWDSFDNANKVIEAYREIIEWQRQ